MFTKPIHLILGSLALTLLCEGCVKRTETVTVFPDGHAFLLTQVEGDPEDLNTGDAMPTAAAGWEVSERRVKDSNGDETIERTAYRGVGAREPLPETYAPAGSATELIALRFPTEVTIEERPDGTYYHFRRTYSGRLFARVEYIRTTIFESDRLKSISEKNPEELTDEDRRALAQALIEFEGRKNAIFIDLAIERLDQPLAQDAWLEARQRALDVYSGDALLEQTVALLKSEDVGVEVEALEAQLRDQVASELRTVLADWKIPHLVVQGILEEYELARQSYEVTGDLGDEEWTVAVSLPGRIVGHNAGGQSEAFDKFLDRAPADLELNVEPLVAATKDRTAGLETVTWTFDGKALRDRDVILMASSVMPKD